MSGLVSGITKIFTSLGTGAATLGSAVRGVGASLFTAGAATGSSVASQAAGGGGLLSGLFNSGGTLGSMLSGAAKQALSGGLIGGIMGKISGEDFTSGFKQGAIGGAVSGGVMSGIDSLFSPAYAGGGQGVDPTTTGSTSPLVPDPNAATGARPDPLKHVGGASVGGSGSGYFAPRGLGTGDSSTQPPGTQPQAGGFWDKGFGKFLSTEGGAGLIAGLGAGIGSYQEAKTYEEQKALDRKAERDKEKRITDSYNVPMSALAGGVPSIVTKTSWQYNPQTGQIDTVAA